MSDKQKVAAKAVVMIATPAYTGDVCYEYAQSLTLAAIQCAMRGIILDPTFVSGCSLIDTGRNYLMAEFIERKIYTHLFWIDSDLGFDPSCVLRMISYGLDAVAGVYSTKSAEQPKYPYQAAGPVDPQTKLQLGERVPGGFILLSRRAVDKLVENCDEWYMIETDGKERNSPCLFDVRTEAFTGGKRLIGEDYTFCERLHRADIPLWVDTNINFLHIGRRPYPGNLYKTLEREASEQVGKGMGTAEAQAHGLSLIQQAKNDKNKPK